MSWKLQHTRLHFSAVPVNKQNKAWQGSSDFMLTFTVSSQKISASISVTGSRVGTTNFEDSKNYKMLAQLNYTTACHFPGKNQRLLTCPFHIFIFVTQDYKIIIT